MSRFFLVVKSEGSPALDISEKGLKSVISGFENTGATLYHKIIDNKTALLISGRDRSIDFNGFSFRTGTALIHDTHGSFSEMARGFVSLAVDCDSDKILVRSNLVGGRAAWYYKDSDLFILSSSQRAIVRFLGSFEFNEQAMVWMLSTGNLGPGNSWDKRLVQLGADSNLSLTRATWELEHRRLTRPKREANYRNSDHVFFDPNDACQDLFSILNYSHEHEVLALNGGVKSRLLLSRIQDDYGRMDTVTWGPLTAKEANDSDAYIAAQLAEQAKVANFYFATDLSASDFTTHIEQYIRSGEGRVDLDDPFLAPSYLWNKLASKQYKILYRGDSMDNFLTPGSEKEIGLSLGFHRMEDNESMVALEQFDLPQQEFPALLLREPTESLQEWSNRLLQTFHIPNVVTGFHDLASSYLEVFNPFFHEYLLNNQKFFSQMRVDVRNMPSRQIYPGASPIPWARPKQLNEPFYLLRSARFVAAFLDEFHSVDSSSLFGKKLLQWLQKHLIVEDDRVNSFEVSTRRFWRKHFSWPLYNYSHLNYKGYRVDFNRMAYRCYLISRICNLFKEDARSFQALENDQVT